MPTSVVYERNKFAFGLDNTATWKEISFHLEGYYSTNYHNHLRKWLSKNALFYRTILLHICPEKIIIWSQNLLALLLNLFCYFKIKRIFIKIKCEIRRTFLEYTLGNNLLLHWYIYSSFLLNCLVSHSIKEKMQKYENCIALYKILL